MGGRIGDGLPRPGPSLATLAGARRSVQLPLEHPASELSRIRTTPVGVSGSAPAHPAAGGLVLTPSYCQADSDGDHGQPPGTAHRLETTGRASEPRARRTRAQRPGKVGGKEK